MRPRSNENNMDERTARMALLAAGTVLFAKKGYAGASVREIVELAGMTKPMLYYYFASKEGLFRSILDWGAAIQEELLSRVLESRGTFVERLTLLYRSVHGAVLEHMDFFRLIHNLVFGAPQSAPKYDVDIYHTRMMDTIKTIYLDGIERGEVRKEDPDEVTALLMGLMNFCFHSMFFSSDDGNPERLESLLRIAYQGLRWKEADQ
jgi:AcrR family transcriptional regulator